MTSPDYTFSIFKLNDYLEINNCCKIYAWSRNIQAPQNPFDHPSQKFFISIRVEVHTKISKIAVMDHLIIWKPLFSNHSNRSNTLLVLSHMETNIYFMGPGLLLG